MSKVATKTNNDLSLVKKKIELRLISLPNKNEINVLEAFGGEGYLWSEVKKQTDKTISILSIDKNNYNKVQLQGDNIKFLKSIDLNKFDIIDLDAWGSPAKQLEILYQRKYKGIVHCTFIQTMFGGIDKGVLIEYGYTDKMLKKCKTLFYKNGVEKIMFYINKKFNVNNVKIISKKNKNYMYFVIN